MLVERYGIDYYIIHEYWNVPMDVLAPLVFEAFVWDPKEAPLTLSEIKECATRGDLNENPFSGTNYASRQDHVRRIAHLALHRWTEPIILEVYEDGGLYIADGNHRVATSHFLGLSTIYANVFGYVSKLKHRTAHVEMA